MAGERVPGTGSFLSAVGDVAEVWGDLQMDAASSGATKHIQRTLNPVELPLRDAPLSEHDVLMLLLHSKGAASQCNLCLCWN